MLGMIASLGGAILGNALDKQNQRTQQESFEENLKKSQTIEQQNAVFSNNLALNNWKNTNYSAQVEELKKAGLSPALMYSKGGQGGTLQAPNVNASGAMINANSQNAQTFGMIGKELVKQAEEIELLKAQTNKTNVDATKTAGVDTELAKMQTLDLGQGIQNKIASEKLTNAQSELAYVAYDFERGSIEDRIKAIETGVKKTEREIYVLENQGKITRAEADVAQKKWKIQLSGMVLDNLFKTENTKLTVEEQKKVKQDVHNSIIQTYTNKRNANTSEQSMLNEQTKTLLQNAVQKSGLELQEQKMYMDALFGILGAGLKAL